MVQTLIFIQKISLYLVVLGMAVVETELANGAEELVWSEELTSMELPP